MKVYVAGKITGLSRWKVLFKFFLAKRKLERQGHKAILPTILPEKVGFEHSDYMHICFSMIDVCDAVFFLSDWQESAGAKLELPYAKEKGKIIFFEKNNYF